MEKLFQLTEGFMEAFLGNSGEEDPNGQTHSIYAAFWGSVDVIWRVSVRLSCFNRTY